MINEIEEFRAYTTFPAYKVGSKNDTSYMGRFTFRMLLRFEGFRHILTLLARGYLYADSDEGYNQIDYARRALLAWCSVSTGRTQTQKKTPNQTDSGNQTNYAIYHAEFPDLVDEAGDGWLIRHVENLLRFVGENTASVRADALRNAAKLKNFRTEWEKRVDHFQTVPFSKNTNGKWGLRIEDALADALVLGPLKNRDFDLPEPVTCRLTEQTPKGVPPEVSVLLYKYYMVQCDLSSPVDGNCDTQSRDLLAAPEVPDVESLPFIVLPEQNVSTCFGNTAFSQKWVYALTGPIIERKTADGVCKYRITKALME